MNQRTSNFKISPDDERPDSYMRPRRESVKIDNLNRKIVMTSVLIFFILVAVAAAGYFYVRTKFDIINNDGFKGLSQDLESRYADLSQRIVKLEETFRKEVAPIGELSLNFEETATAVKENIQKTETVIGEMRNSLNEVRTSLNDLKALKADRKDIEKLDKVDKLEKAVGELSKTVETLYSDMKTWESQAKGWDDKISKQSAKMVESVERAASDVNKIQAEISKQSFNKIDQKMLDLALRKQQEKFQKDLSDITGRLQEREDLVKSLERRVRELEMSPRTPLSPRPSSGRQSGGTSGRDPIVEQNLE